MKNGINDIFFAFVSCEKNRGRWRRIHSMCEKFGIENYRIFIGGIYTYDNISSSIVELPCADGYEDLPTKIFMMYKYSFLKVKYKYLWKIDDDVDILNLDENTLDRLFNSINGEDYCGFKVLTKPGKRRWHCGKCSKDSLWNNKTYNGDYIPWAEGGRSYLLSEAATSVFNQSINYSALAKNEIYEDLAVAKFLKEVNIEPTEIFPWEYNKVIKKDLYL